MFDDEGFGLGNESSILFKWAEDTMVHYRLPFTRMRRDPAIRFSELKAIWEKETRFISSITQVSMHPAYQQIIGMGKTALPFIFKELSIEPNNWFWALKAITGEDPVPPEKRGRVKEMARLWLLWWVRKKYLNEY